MNVYAVFKNAKISGQKVRLIANKIVGFSAEKSMDILQFSNKKASIILKKVIRSAIANAEHNFGMDIDELVIDKICINKASSFKRFKSRAKGRSNKIIKKNCHIYIKLKIGK